MIFRFTLLKPIKDPIINVLFKIYTHYFQNPAQASLLDYLIPINATIKAVIPGFGPN